MHNPVIPPLSPMLAFPDPAAAIAWYETALDAKEAMRLTTGDMIVHAELEVHGGLVMLSQENPEWNCSPQTGGNTTVVLNLLVENADVAFEKALGAGATVIFPLADQFYGYRGGRIRDPFGYQWILSHKIEDVSPEEMQRRMQAE